MGAVGRVSRVLVSYEPSRHGRAALWHALSVARAAGATVTVATVVPQERTDAGCTHCRATASAWNEQLRALAHEWLSEAAELVGDSPSVRYLAACGPERQVLTLAARKDDVDLVVVPWRRAERARRLLRRSLAERLRGHGRWDVVIAPPARSTTLRQGATTERRPRTG